MIYIMAKTKATGKITPFEMFENDQMSEAVVRLLAARKRYTRSFLYIQKGNKGRGRLP